MNALILILSLCLCGNNLFAQEELASDPAQVKSSPSQPSEKEKTDAQEELKNNRNFQAGIRAIKNKQLGIACQHLLRCSQEQKLSVAAKHIVNLTLAESYTRNNKANLALEIYDKLPDSQVPPYWKGVALSLNGKWTKALPYLYSVPTEPSETYWLAQQAIAYTALCLKDQHLLQKTHEQLIQSPIQFISLRARLSLASHFISKHEASKALETIEAVLQSNSPEAQSLHNIARLLEVRALNMQGEWSKSKEICNRILEDKKIPLKTKDSATISLAETFLSEEKAFKGNSIHKPATNTDSPDETGKGEGILLNFISSNPDSSMIPEALRLLIDEKTFQNNTLAYQKLGEWSKEKQTKRAPLALQTLALIQHAMDNQNEALATINTLVNRFAAHPSTQAMILKGSDWLIHAKRLEEARALLKKSTQKSALSLMTGGILAFEEKNFELAEAQFEEARALANELLEPTATLNTQSAALMGEDFQTADKLSMQARNNPELHATMSYQAASIAAHYLQADGEKRLLDFILSYPESPNIHQARLDLAEWYLLQNPPNTKSAGIQLTQLDDIPLSTETRLRSIQTNLKMHEAMDQKSDSILILRNAIKAFPNNEALLIKLGELLYQSGQYNEALINLQHFIQAFPQSPRLTGALYLAGKAALQTHAVESLSTARKLFQQGAQLESNYQIPSRIEIASILIRQGKAKEALSALDTLLTLRLSQSQRNLALIAKADAWAMLVGSDEQALSQARKNLTEILNTPNISNMWKFQSLSRRANYATQAGDSDAALADYENILALDPSSLPTPKRQDWYWYYSAGFAAMHLLELKQEYARSLALAEHLSHTTSERAEEAAAHAKRIRLENFIYEDDK